MDGFPGDLPAGLSLPGSIPHAREGLSFAGAPVGTIAFAAAFCAGRVATHHARIDSLVDLALRADDAQAGVRLLHQCLVPRPWYLLGCAPPEATAEAARLSDERLLGAWCRLTGVAEAELDGLPPLDRLLLHLPRRFGGLQLRRALRSSRRKRRPGTGRRTATRVTCRQ